jgi:hypothetical protein
MSQISKQTIVTQYNLIRTTHTTKQNQHHD